MIPHWIQEAIVGFNLFVLGYFILLNATYISLCIVSFLLIHRHQRYDELLRDNRLFRAGLPPSVSVICPAFNEEATIIAGLQSLLSLEYPDFEIIVVNDGSSDRTLERLCDTFRLKPSPRAPSGEIPTASIRGIYRSRSHHNLVVVDKENGHSKADALNAGINYTRNPLICAIDADSVLEPDSLIKLVRPFLDDPDTIAVGGVVRILNGSEVRMGRVGEPRLPRNHLARFQIVEYFRAFLFGRVGWAAVNALPLVSGAFGMFARRSILAVGGYCTDAIGEDMELVIRLHRHFRERRIRYRISFVPEPVCWTEAPEDLHVLAMQRNRWQRGLIDSLWRHRRMFLNPRFGILGMVAIPFYAIFEMIGPLIEVSGVIIALVSLALGIVNTSFALMFFCVAVLLGIVLSLVAVFLEGLSYRRYPRVSTGAILMAYGVLENFGYRQLHAVWRLAGIWDKLRGKTAWGMMKRHGFGDALPVNGPGHPQAVEKPEPNEPLARAVGDDLEPALTSSIHPTADRGSPILREISVNDAPIGSGRCPRQNLAPRTYYLVRRVKTGIEVTIKGRSETREVIKTSALKQSVTGAAYRYTDRHLGKRETVGDKGGSLAKRIRTLLREGGPCKSD